MVNLNIFTYLVNPPIRKLSYLPPSLLSGEFSYVTGSDTSYWSFPWRNALLSPHSDSHTGLLHSEYAHLILFWLSVHTSPNPYIIFFTMLNLWHSTSGCHLLEYLLTLILFKNLNVCNWDFFQSQIWCYFALSPKDFTEQSSMGMKGKERRRGKEGV